MKISIITVCHNCEAGIRRTLQSVAVQDWANIEHVVVDGASTDGTLKVVREHGSRVTTLISEPDHGIYDAMNKGVRAARGDVIAFLNADDFYAGPAVISRVARAMEHEKLDALFGDATFFHPKRPDRQVRYYHSGRFRPSRIAWGWMPAHPALFLRTKVYERVGPFRTDYRIAGDFEFIARAFWSMELRYRHLPDILVNMSMGGVSTGGWRNTVLLNREVLRACYQNGIPTNPVKILSKYPAKLLDFLWP